MAGLWGYRAYHLQPARDEFYAPNSVCRQYFFCFSQLRLQLCGENLASSTLLSRQSGVFRTNCIDCLDRTNVVQSMIARRVVDLGLQQLGRGTNPDECKRYLSEVWPDFEQQFQGLWADNADMCSLQYSGTLALKTDFTRTGM